MNSEVEVIGVQPERAASFHESWKKGERVTLKSADSVADGLATRTVFQLPYVIMKDLIDDVVLLTEEEILKGIRVAIETTHNLAEAAGVVTSLTPSRPMLEGIGRGGLLDVPMLATRGLVRASQDPFLEPGLPDRCARGEGQQ